MAVSLTHSFRLAMSDRFPARDSSLPDPLEGQDEPFVGRVLIVEDEESLALGLRDALTHAGHEAEVARNGLEALERVRSQRFDILVLDLMLPGMSGLDLLQVLRDEGSDVRVLILSALSDEDSLVRGFQLGADDYMAKPFSGRELLARIEAQVRRTQLERSHTPRTFEAAPGILIDLGRQEVDRHGERIALTQRESDILAYVINNSERVVTREDLLVDVWRYRNPAVRSRTVDIHIVSLRKKIEPDPAHPQLIQTVRGKGYRWGGS